MRKWYQSIMEITAVYFASILKHNMLVRASFKSFCLTYLRRMAKTNTTHPSAQLVPMQVFVFAVNDMKATAPQKTTSKLLRIA